jgi:hypothetical protein
MASVQEGLEEPGAVEGDGTLTDAHFTNTALGLKGSADRSGVRAEDISEARRVERMRAGSRGSSLAAFGSMSAEEIKASVLDEANDAPDVNAELARQRESVEETPEELQARLDRQRAEYEADPGTIAYRERQAEAQAAQQDLIAEVHESRVQAAYEEALYSNDETDWGIWSQLAREFAAEAPAAFNAYMADWDEQTIAQWDEEYEFDPENYPNDPLPSQSIGEAIKRENAEERLRAEADAAVRASDAQVNQNIDTYESAVRATGLEGKKFEAIADDGKSLISDDALDVAASYIIESGVMFQREDGTLADFKTLIAERGDLAAEALIEALHQRSESEAERRGVVAGNKILDASGTSVSEELARDEARRRGESIDRAVPPIKPFDPSRIGSRPKASRSFEGAQLVRDKDGNVQRNAQGRVEMAAGSLDAASGADSRQVSEGFEIGGKKVSVEKASHTFADEAEAIRRKTRSHFRA